MLYCSGLLSRPIPKILCTEVDRDLLHGSGCTGSDIFAKIIDQCMDYWRDEFLITQKGVNAIQAECCPEKQTFLTEQFNASLLCANVEELSQPKAFDIRHKKMLHVPWVKILVRRDREIA